MKILILICSFLLSVSTMALPAITVAGGATNTSAVIPLQRLQIDMHNDTSQCMFDEGTPDACPLVADQRIKVTLKTYVGTTCDVTAEIKISRINLNTQQHYTDGETTMLSVDKRTRLPPGASGCGMTDTLKEVVVEKVFTGQQFLRVIPGGGRDPWRLVTYLQSFTDQDQWMVEVLP